MRPQCVLRSLPRSAAAPAAARRWVATHAPTTTSAPASEISPGAHLRPGDEIDPQLNGYPQLPLVTLQKREPFGWWDQQERRNFGEVMHEEHDAINMWGPDVHAISGRTALLSLIAAFSAIGAFAYFLDRTRLHRPVASRTYPYGGLEKELGGHNAALPEEEELDE